MNGVLLKRVFVVIAILAIPLLIYLAPELMAGVVAVIAATAPLWLPVVLVMIAIPLWLTFVRSHFIMNVPYTTIELKPGPETPRTARPMELIFYALYHRTDLSLFETYIQGHVRMPWSFEAYAHANTVRFFVHVPTAHRQAVEARIRAEYRDIDIDQVLDYSREIPWNPYSMSLSITEYTLAKPDPYPLKTYQQHETQKHDAFNKVLERLSMVGDSEHAALSVTIRPHQRERRKLFDTPKDFLHEDAQREIVRLLGKQGDINAVPEATKKTIAAIESALKKPSFDCAVRSLYVADRDSYSEEFQNSLSAILEPFDDSELNRFAPYDPREQVQWPLREIFSAVPALWSQFFLQMYRRRSFFYPPYIGRTFVLNTEELATLFHIPHFGRVSALANARGVRLDPPDNLPI